MLTVNSRSVIVESPWEIACWFANIGPLMLGDRSADRGFHHRIVGGLAGVHRRPLEIGRCLDELRRLAGPRGSGVMGSGTYRLLHLLPHPSWLR